MRPPEKQLTVRMTPQEWNALVVLAAQGVGAQWTSLAKTAMNALQRVAK
jgi:hypothetical protein